MKKILNFLTGNVLKEIGNVIDNIFTNDEERLQAKNELTRIIQSKELELQKMQTDVIVAEANGNWLQRSWRPILMLAFGFIVIYVNLLHLCSGLRSRNLKKIFGIYYKLVLVGM